MIKYIVLLAVLVMFQQRAYSQRCGDAIVFSIVNKDTGQMDSLWLSVTGYIYDGYSRNNESVSTTGLILKYNMDSSKETESVYVTPIDKLVDWQDGGKFMLRTMCGIRLMSVVIEDRSSAKTMTLNIYNIPGDVPIKTEDFIFKSGTYELNINRTLDLKTFKKDSNGDYIVKQKSFSQAE
jgi:hypothetical protein